MQMKHFILIAFLSATLSVSPTRAQQFYERSTSLVTIDGEGFYVHTVKRGETLYSLSRLYSVAEDEIRASNPHVADGLQEGQVIKVPAHLDEKTEKLSPRKQSRTFDTHVVNQGETLYSISRRYEIPINTLLEDNPGLDPSTLSIGQELNIRKKSRGDATPEEIEEQINDYRDAINSLPTGFTYHIVERGETIFGLSKMYDVTEEDIINNNDLADGLKAGDMIRIPLREDQNPIAGIELPTDSIAVEPPHEGPDTLFYDGMYGDAVVGTFTGGKAPKVAVLLPLKNPDGEANRNFIDFYHGFLLGLENLKSEGYSADVVLYNTSRSSSVIYDITESEGFGGTDVIIGPIYEDNIQPALHYAQLHSVPVVSPLAAVDRIGSGLLYQMSPDRATKYDKLRGLMSQDYNIIFVSSTYKDEEMESEIRPLMPQDARFINLSGNLTARQVTDALDRTRENLIFVSCTNELVADQIMATISSVQNNLVARSMSGGGIKVVVTPRWARFGRTLDRNLYFKLNVCYVTNYHADRGHAVIRGFDNRFISAFGSVPTQYAYRGYDTAKLFVGAAARGGDYNRNLNSGDIPLLQMRYRFERTGPSGTMVNGQWALVCYRSDYTIEVL